VWRQGDPLHPVTSLVPSLYRPKAGHHHVHVLRAVAYRQYYMYTECMGYSFQRGNCSGKGVVKIDQGISVFAFYKPQVTQKGERHASKRSEDNAQSKRLPELTLFSVQRPPSSLVFSYTKSIHDAVKRDGLGGTTVRCGTDNPRVPSGQRECAVCNRKLVKRA
jgi:hypothetical protein